MVAPRNKRLSRKPRFDGIYVIRTSESVALIGFADTVRSHKSLAQVERAFRTLKGVDLLIRPIRHRTEDRVPAHIFLCLLAYYVEWHLRQAWAPLLFEDEQLAQERRRRDPILPATGSPSAQERSSPGRRRTVSVHSFATLLMAELASRARVTYGLKSEESTPKLLAGARADCAASQGLCAARLVASSWKLNFELSLGESAEYRPNPSGTSA